MDGYDANTGSQGANRDGIDDGIVLDQGAVNPMFPLIADFNGDGLPDIAVSGNNGAWSVDLLQQSSNGDFSVSDSDSAGQNPQYLAAGDFNEDGRVDIVAGALYTGVLVFLNDGGGTATVSRAGPTYLSPHHQYVAAADFNGDGHLDIAARGDVTASVSILYGDGLGGFPTSAEFATSGVGGYLAVADVNGDGSTDLVVASTSTRSVDVLLNDDDGGLAARQSFALDAAPWGVAVNDFNQDGRIDIAVSRADNTVQVLWNQAETITVALKYVGNDPDAPYYEWQGTSGNDVITGYGGHINRIYGGSGNDVLSAGKHAPLDLLSGGNLLVGDDGNDTLKGGLGDDQLYGGTGADVMMGGPGDDTYGVDDPGDVIVERASWAPVQGGDVVYSTIDFSLAGIPVERLLLEGSAVRGTGNGLRNTITGDAGDNILDGGKNVDTLYGGLGDDLYLLRTPGDRAIENFATDDELARGGHDTVWAFGSFHARPRHRGHRPAGHDRQDRPAGAGPDRHRQRRG